MKKILIIIFSIFLLTLNLITLKIFNIQKEYNVLYNNKLTLSFDDSEHSIDFDKFSSDIANISDELQIDISQYDYTSENSLYIYSTNIKNNKSFSIIKGRIPNIDTSEYISNKNESNNVGIVKIPSDNFYIRIYNFSEIKNIGMENQFIISNINSEDYQTVIDTFNKYGEVKIEANEPQIMYSVLFSNPSLLISFILASLLLVFSITYYIINSKKGIGIEKIFGFNISTIMYNLILPILKIISTVDILIIFGISIYAYLNKENIFFMQFIEISIAILILILVVTFLYTIFICNIVVTTMDLKEVLKNKGDKTGLDRLTYLNKLIICIAIIFISVMLSNGYSKLNNKLNGLEYWEKTRNVYKVLISTSPDLDNLQIGRVQNDKLQNLYKELRENKQLFIMNSNNYTLLSNNKYAYSKSVEYGDFEYGITGKSIIVDKNYLKQNSIIPYNTDKDLGDLIDNNPNVLNILVPYEYKNMEKEIYNNYLNTFYFMKIEVDNLYRKYMNLSLNETKKDDLSINIIYVKENQKYFTYSPDSGNEEDDNSIIDPVTLIYTDNVDTSYIFAWMTSSMYFIDESDNNAYSNISKYLEKTNTKNIVQKYVISVYSQVNSEIVKLNNQIRDFKFIIFILLIVIIFFSFTCISLFYKNNFYKIYLKTLLGYSNINTNCVIIYSIIIINSIAMLLNVFINLSSTLFILLIGTGITIFEFLLTYIFSIYLNKKNINEIIKGEK